MHGHVLTRVAFTRSSSGAALPLEERRRVPGLEPERAPSSSPARSSCAKCWRDTTSPSSRRAITTSSTARCSLPPRAAAAGRGRRPAWRLHVLLRYGLVASNIGSFSKPANVVRLAEQAEAAGWEALFLWDHLAWVWDGPAADPWVTLGAVAVRTGTAARHLRHTRPAPASSSARAPGGDARRALGRPGRLGRGARRQPQGVRGVRRELRRGAPLAAAGGRARRHSRALGRPARAA